MKAQPLAVAGAYVFTPQIHPDERGVFVSHFQESDFRAALGHSLFAVAQVSHSRSVQGVARGIHYTRTPPGAAKYVHCPAGRAYDFVVDLRVGSPTYGRWDGVLLDPLHHRAVYLPPGVGHAFVAVESDTVMTYLLSREYDPANELAVSILDPAIALDLPAGLTPLLSPRDRQARTLAQARAAGLLPEYAACQAVEQPARAR
ncbi:MULTISPECIES: dTDP-4-dehydrorhamnose 3,5-epimerase family protein [unclassified Solwaraspora]|uniref:dTDP-4-dehydrorhamnose 3,5-epimerase family protein n=1 Tax=unclassified Solwaraspora TaxID=2627926 RepID=UPI00259B39BD|nr:dTDP-4-dehydrorhamnose 3,5-epimerase family protein [Solwaraspora sp. WMMA2056]WJK38411.1 dTDP-4-dehydrorhamnose 3,5-epimerase family protein [Solwaraspora sp. WMMA2056]